MKKFTPLIVISLFSIIALFAGEAQAKKFDFDSHFSTLYQEGCSVPNPLDNDAACSEAKNQCQAMLKDCVMVAASNPKHDCEINGTNGDHISCNNYETEVGCNAQDEDGNCLNEDVGQVTHYSFQKKVNSCIQKAKQHSALSLNLSCETAFCGNAKIEGGEACDDGMNNGQPGHCNAGCKSVAFPSGPSCGNNVMDAGEECDGTAWPVGVSKNMSGCTSQCKIFTVTLGGSAGPVCNNGTLEAGEKCDGNLFENSNVPAGTICNATCDSYTLPQNQPNAELNLAHMKDACQLEMNGNAACSHAQLKCKSLHESCIQNGHPLDNCDSYAATQAQIPVLCENSDLDPTVKEEPEGIADPTKATVPQSKDPNLSAMGGSACTLGGATAIHDGGFLWAGFIGSAIAFLRARKR